MRTLRIASPKKTGGKRNSALSLHRYLEGRKIQIAAQLVSSSAFSGMRTPLYATDNVSHGGDYRVGSGFRELFLLGWLIGVADDLWRIPSALAYSGTPGSGN